MNLVIKSPMQQSNHKHILTFPMQNPPQDELEFLLLGTIFVAERHLKN